jgi:hypothetical protein
MTVNVDQYGNMYMFAVGYHQGRAVGTWEHPLWEEWSSEEQRLYRLGYDSGVSDYCHFDMEEVAN